ncbi:MAG TPA: AarF/UbiB family protein [Gaiellaceae bacterium]|nr:AarF/UbiB family protein [Gaiellaceae bacterium]
MNIVPGASSEVVEQSRRAKIARATQISRVLARHGVEELFAGNGRRSTRERARRLRAALEELGPTFAKVGQIISTRPDLVPAEFVQELEQLQEHVAPLAESEVVAVLTDELGMPWEDVFATIESRPLATGTIAQVHRATLERGDRVVVKVQRPEARDDIVRDLALLELVARRVGVRPSVRRIVDLPAVMDHLSTSLVRELDFTEEARNTERLREILVPYPRIAVPALYSELSTPRLLVLEEVRGVPLRHAPPGAARREAARQLLEAYFHQIITRGVFHADPHPGNMKWWKERIYLLDFGMVGELERETRDLLALVVMAFWQEDAAFLTELVLMLGGDQQRADIDSDAVRRELGGQIARFRHSTLAEVQLGPILQSITGTAVRHGVHVPASLALTGKALTQMQLAAAELDPTLDAFTVAGDMLLRGFAPELHAQIDYKRLLYDLQKLRLRVTRGLEAVERLVGARAGPRPAIEVNGIDRLATAIRVSTARLAKVVLASACLLGAAIIVGSDRVDGRAAAMAWGLAAACISLLLADLARRGSR